MDDPLYLHLPHEEIKDHLRRRFARAGLRPPFFDRLDEIAFLVRHFGFADFLAGLEIAVQELSRPPIPPVDFAEMARQAEEAIAAFDARLQELPPTYQPGDRVELLNEEFVVHRYQRGEGMTGYWLSRGKEELFLPRDWEDRLQPVTH